MIVVMTGRFEEFDRFGHPTGKKVFGVSHGVNAESFDMIPLPPVNHPRELGAVFNEQYGEWVIYEKNDNAISSGLS
jgi:hypothetical protein